MEKKMIISCPHCKTQYEIDGSIIPLSGKKMRCAKCSEVWKVFPQDWHNFENTILKEHIDTTLENTEDEKISSSTNQYRTSFVKSLAKVIGTLLIALGIVYAYVFRYEIAEFIPATLKIYDTFNLEAKTVGKGLTFKNVIWEEYEDNSIRKMDISGTIINETEKMVELPLLHIELLDSEGNALQNVDKTLTTDYIAAEGVIEFKTTILRPAPFTKYIYITFSKPNNETY